MPTRNCAIEFFVPGKPTGRDEKKTSVIDKRTGKRRTRVFTSDEGRNWRQTVWAYAIRRKPDEPWEGAVTLTACFLLTRPKHHWTPKGVLTAEGRRHPRPISKPDVSNLLKPVEDALKRAGFYRDDSQITDAHPHKRYANREQESGVHITIRKGE